MTLSPHDRTLDHYGTEDDLTSALSAAIGRYPQGMILHDVIADMAARLSFIEGQGCETRIFGVTMDAVIGFPTESSFVADAYILNAAHNLTLDAQIIAVLTSTLTVDTVIIERQPLTNVLVGDVDPGDTTITVSTGSGWPLTDYVIHVGAEDMLVTGGFGTTTWTVTRGYNGTVASFHPDGTEITEEC